MHVQCMSTGTTSSGVNTRGSVVSTKMSSISTGTTSLGVKMSTGAVSTE